MAMLTPPNPRFKPMLTEPQGQQMQQVLREAPTEQTVNGRTPAQIAKERQMAEAMVREGMDYSPIQSWSQGAARLANALVGGWQENRANSEEATGRAGFKAKLDAYDPKAPDADRIAMALSDDPWASEGARGFLNAQMARNNQAPTDDMREYDWAVQNGFKGSPMDYMKALKTPVMQPPQGYSMAPGATPDAPRYAPIPGGPASIPRPQVQSAEDDDVSAIQGTQSINAQLDGIDNMISSGKLDLGLWNNIAARGQNFVGASTENSTNFAQMQATLEKMRNDSLRLNKGVQTEGDAVRAWNELVSNVNDPKVVRAQIARIKVLNDRAAAQRQQMIDIRRQRNNMEPFDPQSVALPSAPEQITPPTSDGMGGIGNTAPAMSATPTGTEPSRPVAPAGPVRWVRDGQGRLVRAQ